MASGAVWVVPARFPANTIVAPNSPRARAQHRVEPATRAGAVAGRVTVRRIISLLAPSVAAASSRRVSTARNPASSVTTRNGAATKAAATTAAAVVKGSETPRPCITPPARPRRPRAVRSPTPATTGGSTMGRTTSARTTRRPGQPARASAHASGAPRRSDRASADSDTTSESRSAATASGRVSSRQARAQGPRTARPRRGRAKKATPTAARDARSSGVSPSPPPLRETKAVLLEHPAALCSGDELDEGLGPGRVGRVGQRSDEVASENAGALGEGQRPNGLFYVVGHIGGVGDARVGLSEGDLG